MLAEHSSSIKRAGTAVFAAACCATVLAACDSSGGGSPTAPVTVTSTRTQTAASAQPSGGSQSGGSQSGGSQAAGGSAPDASSGSAGPSGSSGGTSPAGGGSVALCAESQLRASIDPRPVKNSNRDKDYAVIVDFRNTSSTACVIRGYPGAALVDSSGKQVKEAKRTIRGQLLGLPTSVTSLPSVVLQPGAYASAGLEGVSTREVGAAQAGCDENYPRILVTPPNTETPVPFTVKWPVCSTFEVHPTNIEKDPPA